MMLNWFWVATALVKSQSTDDSVVYISLSTGMITDQSPAGHFGQLIFPNLRQMEEMGRPGPLALKLGPLRLRLDMVYGL